MVQAHVLPYRQHCATNAFSIGSPGRMKFSRPLAAAPHLPAPLLAAA